MKGGATVTFEPLVSSPFIFNSTFHLKEGLLFEGGPVVMFDVPCVFLMYTCLGWGLGGHCILRLLLLAVASPVA